jgi:hypothetical protein
MVIKTFKCTKWKIFKRQKKKILKAGKLYTPEIHRWENLTQSYGSLNGTSRFLFLIWENFLSGNFLFREHCISYYNQTDLNYIHQNLSTTYSKHCAFHTNSHFENGKSCSLETTKLCNLTDAQKKKHLHSCYINTCHVIRVTNNTLNMCDIRLLPWCRWGVCSSGLFIYV